jgi:hypothetical protein
LQLHATPLPVSQDPLLGSTARGGACAHSTRKHAWGDDEVNVVGRAPVPWFHLGLTIVDSLDTLLIAGLHQEYEEVRRWVRQGVKQRNCKRSRLYSGRGLRKGYGSNVA